MPHANVEVKARCSDLAAARERARALATTWVGLDRQVDTYFRTRRGRLKLRESQLSGGQRSDYQVIPVEDPVRLKALLTELLGVHCVVSKEREIGLYENVRIHLDRVEGLGCFLELEAVLDGRAGGEADGHAKVAQLREQLGMRDADLVSVSYEGLLAGAEANAAE
jgi:adenylate cyclase class IV